MNDGYGYMNKPNMKWNEIVKVIVKIVKVRVLKQLLQGKPF